MYLDQKLASSELSLTSVGWFLSLFSLVRFFGHFFTTIIRLSCSNAFSKILLSTANTTQREKEDENANQVIAGNPQQ